jgi:hypothetical protein
MPKDTKDIKKYIRDVVNIKFENIFQTKAHWKNIWNAIEKASQHYFWHKKRHKKDIMGVRNVNVSIGEN